MNSLKLVQFVETLRHQAGGIPTAIEDIQKMTVSLEDGYCLFNLYEQWCGAFSFIPGRVEAVPLILALAEKLLRFPSDDTLALYALPEWKELVQLRGPVESVLLKRCVSCSHFYVCMGTSGFYDANGLVCGSCGNVYFKSYYDSSETPQCSCGEQFKESTACNCPRCGEKENRSEGGMSPFEYFFAHTFIRGPGA